MGRQAEQPPGAGSGRLRWRVGVAGGPLSGLEALPCPTAVPRQTDPGVRKTIDRTPERTYNTQATMVTRAMDPPGFGCSSSKFADQPLEEIECILTET